MIRLFIHILDFYISLINLSLDVRLINNRERCRKKFGFAPRPTLDKLYLVKSSYKRSNRPGMMILDQQSGCCCSACSFFTFQDQVTCI